VGSPFGKAVVIADRRAGSLLRDPDALAALVETSGIDFEIRSTGPGAGPAQLARQALDDGFTFLVAAGDDATIHAVVNGMMDEGGARHPDAVLGVVPTGSDFIRTFGLPQDPAAAAPYLGGDNAWGFDVGMIRCTAGGEPHRRWFVNVAEVGLGAEIVRGAGRLPGVLGHARQLLSFWGAMARFAPVPARIVLDERTFEGSLTNLIVANAQFMQEGRPVAPRAHPGDGKFDVLLAKGTKRDYVETLTKMPKGLHLPSPTIKEYHSVTVAVEAAQPLPIVADGLAVGETPARIELLPGALRLKI
jgi:diacylglycerol kinase family enzyme